MDTTREQFAPRLCSPGGEGWPTPPKVSAAEDRLYGPDLAPVVRLLGTGTVALTDAYALICKAASEDPDVIFSEARSKDEADAEWQKMVADAWELHAQAESIMRVVAERAIARQRRWELARESSGERVANHTG